MMCWQELKIDNWEGFASFVERLNFNEQGDPGWYFRGQSDKAWTLKPSLLRHLGNIEVERALGIEFGSARRFLSQYHIHYSLDGTDRSEWNPIVQWMFMQHYSCPTRLLDWTLSPYVGLYFAIEQSPQEDGAVWLFSSVELNRITDLNYGKLAHGHYECLETHDIKAIYPIEPTHHNERSASQQAVFTICTHILADHGEIIARSLTENHSDLPAYKLIIPAHLKTSFLSKLRVMNIAPSSLFPGLDGLGRASRDYIRLRAWRSHS